MKQTFQGNLNSLTAGSNWRIGPLKHPINKNSYPLNTVRSKRAWLFWRDSILNHCWITFPWSTYLGNHEDGDFLTTDTQAAFSINLSRWRSCALAVTTPDSGQYDPRIWKIQHHGEWASLPENERKSRLFLNRLKVSLFYRCRPWM